MSIETLDIPGSPYSGANMVNRVEAIFRSLASNRKGNTRPSDVQVGEAWIDDNADPVWYIKQWTGSADIVLFVVDSSTDKAYVPVGSGGTGGTTQAAALAALGAEPLIATKLSGFNLALATQGQAEEALVDTALMTPLKTGQLITARIISEELAVLGLDNTKLMTALRTYQQVTDRIASQAQAESGVGDQLMTVTRTAQALAAMGGGAWEPIGSVSAPSGAASLDIMNLIPGGFYRLIFDRISPQYATYPLNAVFRAADWLTTGTYYNGWEYFASSAPVYGPGSYSREGYAQLIGSTQYAHGGPAIKGEALLIMSDAASGDFSTLIFDGYDGYYRQRSHVEYPVSVDMTGIRFYAGYGNIYGTIHVQKLMEG